MQEPEFIGGEVDLRINIYRSQADTNNATINANNEQNGVNYTDNGTNLTKDAISAVKVPDKVKKMPDSAVKVPDNMQAQQIYKYVLENGSITTTKVTEFLGIKPRRARAILLNMVEYSFLKKESAARNTIYVINTEHIHN